MTSSVKMTVNEFNLEIKSLDREENGFLMIGVDVTDIPGNLVLDYLIKAKEDLNVDIKKSWGENAEIFYIPVRNGNWLASVSAMPQNEIFKLSLRHYADRDLAGTLAARADCSGLIEVNEALADQDLILTSREGVMHLVDIVNEFSDEHKVKINNLYGFDFR